ncbi:MAG: hypothetical protein K6F59_00815 [Gammaproteobacteria bacterium]|nr:hypothetical protein [Gammaproteobacteria bacterium]
MEKKLSKIEIILLSIIGALTLAVIGLSIWIIMLKKKQSQPTPSEYYSTKCASFEVQNANLSQGQIIFIGDSITDLFPLDNYFTSLSLATYNRGIGGDVTQGVLDRLKVSLFDLNPSKVVLMIGINDIDSGKTPKQIETNYKKILKKIKDNLPNTEVYCMSIISQHNTIETYTNLRLSYTIPTIMQTNTYIQSLAQEFGYTYVDLFHATCDSDNALIKSYSDDGLHLNANGFEVWSNVIKPYLQ